MPAILSIQNITRTFGSITAVDHLSLDIEQGELFGLIGPDGAGKTTAIRLMLGILKPDSGEGRVGDFDLHSTIDVTAFGLGALLMAIFTARLFGRLHGGNTPLGS